jgi:hypothetical protein
VLTLAHEISSTLNDSKKNATLFPRFNEIGQLIQVFSRASYSCQNQRIKSGPRPLDFGQAEGCLHLYTMQSERIVLQWFLSNMPWGTKKDLLQAYEKQMSSSSQSIELF